MAPKEMRPDSAETSLHKRSCTRCNQRKVKCNRKTPCTACIKNGEECTFPGDKRAPRQLNRPPVGELLARLKELESEVDKLRSNNSNIAYRGESLSQPRDTIQESFQVPNLNALSLPGQSCNIRDDFSLDEFRLQYLQPRQIQRLWRLHEVNVAPLIAILHLPSAQRIINNAMNGVELDAANESLVFAICFSGVISTVPGQCQFEIDHEYEVARKNYEIAFERALDLADILKAKNVVILQAAVLFLLCSRAGGNTRLVWAKTAVIIRLAQSLQLHIDGEKLGLSPFETEMRRRLWWYICILDMLSSEEQAVDTQIRPGMFDTKYPSNINGQDLFPEMTSLPPEREIFTDITHCIMCVTVLNDVYWSPTILDKSAHIPQTDQEHIVTKVGKMLHDKYLSHFDLDVPLQWISATIIRLQLARAWLLVQKPSEEVSSSGSPRNDTAFETAIESVNFSYLLQTNPVTTQWIWLCKSYKQWYIMAYLLTELCARPLCAETDHAWDVVTKMLVQWQQSVQHHTAFEKPFAELVERTAAVRAAKLASQPSNQKGSVRDLQEDPFGVSELEISIGWLRESGL
ncbi:hypothetical protein N7533_001015 [Penicillium manginii]|uniref:uncharacterized protein n=1 Tax=Penicillium manginii TaxID=203109 RepID=UPI0025476329|nr:uncharacterized protein N7533_001015 [Penicillium manginii]KAJ5768432.1 hypothetical protein N7533_001015 [Penicillium manginii]